jgi:creatinine amidohydrolase
VNRKLAELSGPATLEVLNDRSIVVIPTGAIEHHGPHLPLITDYLLADVIGNEAVRQAADDGLDVWILPTIGYTKSDEHSWASGTMWLRWETMMQTVVDLGRAVATTPARKLVFINGHGGNVALLQVALREIRRQFGLQTFLMPSLVKADPLGAEGLDERGLGIHGGTSETSIIMHIRPDLVDLSKAERWVPEHIADFEYIGFNAKPVSFGWLSDDFGPAGVVGDPTQANAEFGARLFQTSVAQAVASLKEINVFSPIDAPVPSAIRGEWKA